MTPDAAAFADAVRGRAAGWDLEGELPSDVRAAAGVAGLLGVGLPARYGGSGGTPHELGEVCASLGGVCSALRGLVTVQGMVTAALLRWGSGEQRGRWLPELARGARIAGFAATEQGAGSDLTGVKTRIDEDDDGSLTVRGAKKWVTFGQVADVFLVLGRTGGRPACALVEADRPGVELEPVEGQLGMRAAQIAHVRFDGVRVPLANQVAPPGFGLSHVAATALDHGRFTAAWGCVGMADACVRLAAAHVTRRTQRGVPLAEHQLVRSALAKAAVDAAAARALCARASRLRSDGDPEAPAATMIAKYAAARAAATVSRGTVQLLGSAGCERDSLAARFFRDAKVMEITEGAAEVAEMNIAAHVLRGSGANP
ncbi:acyl-CoA dehydrogenase [Nonomuraea sp. PA05]|uniref:acyl-CoA dehydrogenase family protein n=1 Tax=Nonomuraea sp. PA05 TaxID=2604466 RepID=UPI0011D7E1AE|nr:acyl-CoA dehydrogenase family protein [Nonomuraea sp. PA05]TYB71030.1 acyl-CoA dehydrogenase [Nonomuraea sp. PA05]